MRTAIIVFAGTFFSSSIMIDFDGCKFIYKNRLFLFFFFRVEFFFYLFYSIFCSIVVGADSTLVLVFTHLNCWSCSHKQIIIIQRFFGLLQFMVVNATDNIQ